jgi:hypothetical protein
MRRLVQLPKLGRRKARHKAEAPSSGFFRRNLFSADDRP